MITDKFYETKTMSNKKILIKNISSVPLHGLSVGGTLEIEVDHEGTPINRDWRRRLHDSKIDGCIEIVSLTKKETK